MLNIVYSPIRDVVGYTEQLAALIEALQLLGTSYMFISVGFFPMSPLYTRDILSCKDTLIRS